MKNKNTLSGLAVANFSKQIDGKETMLCILTNKKGAELTITNYGAKIVSLMVCIIHLSGSEEYVLQSQSGCPCCIISC
mgnify:CR=1 FL=1